MAGVSLLEFLLATLNYFQYLRNSNTVRTVIGFHIQQLDNSDNKDVSKDPFPLANNDVRETISQIIFTPILKSLIIYGAAGIEYLIGPLQLLLGTFDGLVGCK